MRKRIMVVLSVLAFCTSCQKFAEGKEMFRELLTLRDQIATEYHEQVIDVNISTTGVLTVKFVNSPMRSASRDAKQKRADEVAAFVAAHYRHPLKSVSTQFVSKAGVIESGETFVGRSVPTP